MTLETGARLGAYEILGLIGAGGMGQVYRARDTRLQRTVAIKILPPERRENADRLKRFEQEARAAGALNHPNILAVHDVGADRGQPFGRSLEKNPDERFQSGRDLAFAFEAVENLGSGGSGAVGAEAVLRKRPAAAAGADIVLFERSR
jgi:serine/threonine protein kinase